MENQNYTRRRKKKSANSAGLLGVLALLFVFIAVLIVVQACNRIVGNEPPSTSQTAPPSSDNQGGTSPSTGPAGNPEDSTPPESAEPEAPHIVSTASIGTTGDILMHGPVIFAGKTGNSFDYTSMFQYVKPYYERFDVMVANLECTLGGTKAGDYKGYPTFNCPDNIVDALQYAGIDIVLTANNHAYDTGVNGGFTRTQEVLNEKNMSYLGTQLEEDAKEYVVQDINGIKVGMICYTYETNGCDPETNYMEDRVYLNEIRLSAEDSKKVTCFSPYKDLGIFYSGLEDQLSAMEAEGAEATVVFIHWGAEYALSPNSTQKKIAQKLCDMGVDVIVGGHPHVIEPFETLTGKDGNKTYCIYSVGNALSNQNRNTLADTTSNCKYTEDGMIFGVTFQKWNDGTVQVAEIEILPTWVDKFNANTSNGVDYRIYPLDSSLETWDSFNASKASRLAESYARTMGLVGEGLNLCRENLGLDAVPTSVENK